MDEIDRMLSNIEERYPGSKKMRRPANPTAQKRALGDGTGWDEVNRPYLKTINGKPTEVWTIGALADALGRPLVTIRLWTRKGYIPRAPYRLPSRMVNGKEQKGRRLYTRPMIEATVKAFAARSLLEKPRIEWSKHTDLSIELLETWTHIHAQETGR